MALLNIGDKVALTKDLVGTCATLREGAEGTITALTDNILYPYEVEIDLHYQGQTIKGVLLTASEVEKVA